MQVKRFVAADMRRALELVRQDMGPDAIILSSSRTANGVELLTTLGSDSELMQMQQQPLGKMALSTASPMLSDGAWAETSVIERAAKQHSGDLAKAGFSGSNKLGKSGKQLADEIEQARLRMLASHHAEDSAKEFLVGKNTRVNASIPRFADSTNPRFADTANASLSDFAQSLNVAKAQTQHKSASAPVGRKRSGEREPAKATPKKIMTAAERYPLVDSPLDRGPVDSRFDDEPKVSIKSTEILSNNEQLQELHAEIADMRLLLEQQLDRLTGVTASSLSGSPILGSISRRLERLGLPADVVSNVLKRCTKTSSLSEAWPDALANLAHQLPINGRDVTEQGGVFAFVGPTGVGKTTTIGKLAARYVMQHGADKVALITTDTYRIAAHDQLRSLARILRVPVRVVDESNPLEVLLRSLRHCSLILIDTAGFRHGDPHLKAQLKALAEQPQVKTYLVLSCNSQEQMLKASVHAYGAARLQGCILTKLDETSSMGGALGVVMQNRLPVVYTTDGQDIPKNIEVARAHQLVAKAAALIKNQSASAVS